MKTINLNVEYPKREFRESEEEGNKDYTPLKASLNVMSVGVALAYSQKSGKLMPLNEQKMWSKILDKVMDDNGEPCVGDIELSDEQFDFIYKIVTTTEYPTNYSNVRPAFAEYLDKVKLEQK